MAWTEITRTKYRRDGLRYASDTTDKEWCVIEPHLPTPARLGRTSRELLERLQDEQPGSYPDGQLRTLQRRMKGWRRDLAHQLVFETAAVETSMGIDEATGAGL